MQQRSNWRIHTAPMSASMTCSSSSNGGAGSWPFLYLNRRHPIRTNKPTRLSATGTIGWRRATASDYARLPKGHELEQSETEWAEPLDGTLPYTGAEVVWAVRHELALTLEDVLARRTWALFLNAQAAIRMAPRVVDLMARELGRDADWQSRQLAAFREVAKGYLLG